MSRYFKPYQVKSLIDGRLIGLEAGKQYVAIPDTLAGQEIRVFFNQTTMDILDYKDALMYRRFRDKYYTATNGRRQYYTLAYFEYKPDIKE